MSELIVGPDKYKLTDEDRRLMSSVGVSYAESDPVVCTEYDLVVNKIFAELLPAPTITSSDELEQQLIATGGPIDPIRTWGNTIIDGHRRYAICKRLKLPYKRVQVELETMEDVMVWMFIYQLSRRNVSASHSMVLREKLAIALLNKGMGKRDAILKAAKILGVSDRTIERAVTFSNHTTKLHPEVRALLMAHGLPKYDFEILAGKPHSEQVRIVNSVPHDRQCLISAIRKSGFNDPRVVAAIEERVGLQYEVERDERRKAELAGKEQRYQPVSMLQNQALIRQITDAKKVLGKLNRLIAKISYFAPRSTYIDARFMMKTIDTILTKWESEAQMADLNNLQTDQEE